MIGERHGDHLQIGCSVFYFPLPPNESFPLLQTLGKDRIIFVTKEDHETPSSAELVADDPNDPYEEHGER